MNQALLDLVETIKSTRSAESVGKYFMHFCEKIGAVNSHMFMQTGTGGFRATTIPWGVLEAEIHHPNLEKSHVLKQVRLGTPNVFWGVDIDPKVPQLTQCDREISLSRFDLAKQRNSVTFPMPDRDGSYTGAGVGIGFEEKESQFLSLMKESCGTLSIASFAAHTQIQQLIAYERVPSPLSKRQAEILSYLAQGYQLASIADRLNLADSTVNLHLSQLKKKLGVKTKEQALAIALTSKWIEP